MATVVPIVKTTQNGSKGTFAIRKSPRMRKKSNFEIVWGGWMYGWLRNHLYK